MNIMLTGATGHLGTHITNQAIANHIDHFHIGVRNVEKVQKIGVEKFLFDNWIILIKKAW